MNQNHPLPIIGITGGIASGKSWIARYLTKHGYTIIDADKLGHRVLEPNQVSYQEIVETFGREILNSDQTINRKRLGAIVFNDKQQLQKLNAISHPRIAQMVLDEVQEKAPHSKEGMVFLESALLLESKTLPPSLQIWVVVTSPDIAKKRLMKRNDLTDAEAQARLNSQATNEERIPHADVVIENNGSVKALEQQIETILVDTDFQKLRDLTKPACS